MTMRILAVLMLALALCAGRAVTGEQTRPVAAPSPDGPWEQFIIAPRPISVSQPSPSVAPPGTPTPLPVYVPDPGGRGVVPTGPGTGSVPVVPPPIGMGPSVPGTQPTWVQQPTVSGPCHPYPAPVLVLPIMLPSAQVVSVGGFTYTSSPTFETHYLVVPYTQGLTGFQMSGAGWVGGPGRKK